jgi:hypothetical protein
MWLTGKLKLTKPLFSIDLAYLLQFHSECVLLGRKATNPDLFFCDDDCRKNAGLSATTSRKRKGGPKGVASSQKGPKRLDLFSLYIFKPYLGKLNVPTYGSGLIYKM